MSLAPLNICLCVRGRLPRRCRRRRRRGRCVITKRPAATRTTAGASELGGATRRAHLCTKPQPSLSLFHSLPKLKHWLDFCPFFWPPHKILSAVGPTPLPNLIPTSLLSTHNPRAFPCTYFVCFMGASLVRSSPSRSAAHSLAKKRRNTLPESMALTTGRMA